MHEPSQQGIPLFTSFLGITLQEYERKERHIYKGIKRTLLLEIYLLQEQSSVH